jgi:hypothetical protein
MKFFPSGLLYLTIALLGVAEQASYAADMNVIRPDVFFMKAKEYQTLSEAFARYPVGDSDKTFEEFSRSFALFMFIEIHRVSQELELLHQSPKVPFEEKVTEEILRKIEEYDRPFRDKLTISPQEMREYVRWVANLFPAENIMKTVLKAFLDFPAYDDNLKLTICVNLIAQGKANWLPVNI